MRSLLVALLLATACGGSSGKASAFPGSGYRSPLNEEVAQPGAFEAVAAARAGWEKALGPIPGPTPRIRWFTGVPVTYKGLTIKVNSIYWAGKPGEIQIGMTEDGARAQSLLIHELGHWARYQKTGDSDGAHADKAHWAHEATIRPAVAEAWPGP